MFSGKSTWLNRRLTTMADQGIKVLKIIHSDDERETPGGNSDCGTSHHSSFFGLSEKIDCIKVNDIKSVDADGYSVIGIDESQFFEGLCDTVKKWVDSGKHVKIAGLDGDSNKQPFGETLCLVPFCDDIKKLNAICTSCLKDTGIACVGSCKAIFTKRIIEAEGQKLVGGAESYIPTCRYHHH